MRYKTIVPFHDLHLPSGASFSFSGDAHIDAVPAWLREDLFVKELGLQDQDELARCTHCLIHDYHVAQPLSSVPASGAKPRSIHGVKVDLSYLVNLSLWLQHDSRAGFSLVFRAEELSGDFKVQKPPARHDRFLCLDPTRAIVHEDLVSAQKLYSALSTIPRHSAPWTACRAVTSALQMRRGQIRDLLLWIALEALFGSDTEITYRLSQRVALFVADDRAEARQIFAEVKQGYKVRCKLAHGEWGRDTDDQEKFTSHIARTETLVRRCFVRLLRDEASLAQFCGKNRNVFLDSLPFAESMG